MREKAPLSYLLHSAGPAARPTMILDWVFIAITLGVCVVIALLLLGAIYHKRPQHDKDEIIESGPGLNWALSGTAVSTVILLGMAIYSLIVLNESATPPKKPELAIEVTGYDWWWKAVYPGFETANEIHIPVGVPVLVKLKSADVIHAFWVPELAGKTEMIPGLENQQWLQADKAGVYKGQCTQFCGVQHAHMAFEVVAESMTDFKAWEAHQLQSANSSDEDGQKIFNKQCSGCHTVRGTEAKGQHGPDLTHVASRRMLAAGLMENTPQNVVEWIRHAQELKPGSRMPDVKLNADEQAQLSAYMDGLK